MTETLGWGDVDVDEAPRRRRRLPLVLIWVVVAAVVAGLAVWPPAKDRLADRAAAWLQRQWQAGGNYDSSRSDIEQTAFQRLATGDSPTLVALVQALDREEADKLAALAAAIGRHRTWTGSVTSVAKSVRQAFLGEAGDLRADVAAAPRTVPTSIYPESPYSTKTDGLVNRAAGQMSRMLHVRHLKPDTKSRAVLTSAADLVADLQRITAAPVDMRLAVMHGAQLDVWDLQTGQVRRNVVGYLPINPPTGVLPVVGSSLLAQFEANWQLWPTAGRRPISLPPASSNGFYQPAGGDGLWRTESGNIRRYDATGHPVGSWHPYPHGFEVGAAAATGDAIAGFIYSENFDARPRPPVLWYPATGLVVPFGDPCFGSVTSARHALAYSSCDPSSVQVMDTPTRRVQTIHFPRGLVLAGAAPVLSPDGTKLAAQVQPRNNVDTPATLLIYDLTKPGVTQLATPATPFTWSADSAVLLLDVNSQDPTAPTATTSETTSIYSPLAYWTAGMKELAGIRLNLTDGSFGVAAIP